MSVFVLLLVLVVLAVSYWGASRVITKAGYAPAWILVPLSPLVLTVVVFIMAYIDLRSLTESLPFGVGSTAFISNLSAVGTVWDIDKFTIFANWIFFLIFAFSRWPGALGADPARGGSALPPAPGVSPQYGRSVPGPLRPSGGASPSPSATTPGGSSTGDAPSDVAPNVPTARPATAPSVGSVRTKHCAWCGESLPGSRALFHDCGPKDRPVSNCVTCGASLPADGAACLACTSG
jgi:hypothetical protein